VRPPNVLLPDYPAVGYLDDYRHLCDQPLSVTTSDGATHRVDHPGLPGAQILKACVWFEHGMRAGGGLERRDVIV